MASPFGAPFARAFIALDAVYVVNLPTAVDEQVQKLSQSRLVESAAGGIGRAVNGHRIRNSQGQGRSGTLERAPEECFGDRAQLLEGNRAGDEARSFHYRSPGAGDGVVDIVSENLSGTHEELIRVRPATDKRTKSRGFCKRDFLSALCRFGIAPDLRVDCVAEPKSLVPQLLNIFRVDLILGRIDSSNRFEQTERNSCVYVRGHLSW